MAKLSDYVNMYAINPVWSFIVNLGYWVLNINNLKNTIAAKGIIKRSIINREDVEKEINKFRWRKDRLKDWHPWVITIVHNNLSDDCDGAAYYGKWLFKCAGIKSKIYRLRSYNKGHMVCITDGKRFMISNAYLIKITNVDFEKFVLDYFNGTYEYMM